MKCSKCDYFNNELGCRINLSIDDCKEYLRMTHKKGDNTYELKDNENIYEAIQVLGKLEDKYYYE